MSLEFQFFRFQGNFLGSIRGCLPKLRLGLVLSLFRTLRADLRTRKCIPPVNRIINGLPFETLRCKFCTRLFFACTCRCQEQARWIASAGLWNQTMKRAKKTQKTHQLLEKGAQIMPIVEMVRNNLQQSRSMT